MASKRAHEAVERLTKAKLDAIAQGATLVAPATIGHAVIEILDRSEALTRESLIAQLRAAIGQNKPTTTALALAALHRIKAGD